MVYLAIRHYVLEGEQKSLKLNRVAPPFGWKYRTRTTCRLNFRVFFSCLGSFLTITKFRSESNAFYCV